ncbi:uncharacterized protein LOC112563319 [Pomacea canaliculata]|uniref:uncharacterized protein LOC112563319 n=1 Tax=Pomacea canaliculata TaxID=400727 RepID=UPI000D725BE4|nr:uncharacterized protein LOC112563319 [Pomacea canaliculata]
MRRLSSRNHKSTSNYTPDHACDDLADEEQPSIVGKLTGTTVSTQMKTLRSKRPAVQQKRKKRKCQERPELCFSGGRLKTSNDQGTPSNLQDVCTSTNVMSLKTLLLSGLQRTTTHASLHHTSTSSDISACSENPATVLWPGKSCRPTGTTDGNGTALDDDLTKGKSYAKSEEIPKLSVFTQCNENVVPCDENLAYRRHEALSSVQTSTSDVFRNQTLFAPGLFSTTVVQVKSLGTNTMSSIPAQAMFSKTIKDGVSHPQTASITKRVRRRKTGRKGHSNKSRAPQLQANSRTRTKTQSVNVHVQESIGWTTSQTFSASPVSAITTTEKQPLSETETTAQQTGARALPKGFLLPESAASSKQVRPAINDRGVTLRSGVSLGLTQAYVDVISSVRSVLLVADEELTRHSDCSDLQRFWEADFTNITMSPATWASVDIWE